MDVSKCSQKVPAIDSHVCLVSQKDEAIQMESYTTITPYCVFYAKSRVEKKLFLVPFQKAAKHLQIKYTGLFICRLQVVCKRLIFSFVELLMMLS